MTRIILDKRGMSLAYETGCMIIRGGKRHYRSVPMSRISQVICMHSVEISTQLIGQLLKHGVDFVVMNNRYPDHGFELFADQQKQVHKRYTQYQWQAAPDLALKLAKQIVAHKCKTLIRLICLQTGSAAGFLNKNMIYRCHTIDALRGLEGGMQRKAFEYWRGFIPNEFQFNKRMRRPPPDPVNALLSLSYTLVFHEAVRQCKRYGLDPALGFYHTLCSGRASLACDVMEPTRPLVEQFVVNLIQHKTLTQRHFSKQDQQGCRLGKEGRTVFYKEFNQFMEANKTAIEVPVRWLSRMINKTTTQHEVA